jgi:hypothetical protein
MMMKRILVVANLAIAALCVLLGGQSSAAQPPKDEIIPVIEMEQVPLTEAIRSLARKARLNILLDPRLSQPPYSRMMVAFRWEDVTARDALTALLENHGLVFMGIPAPFPDLPTERRQKTAR